MDKQFRLTFYWTYYHLSMPGFKLNDISFCCRYIIGQNFMLRHGYIIVISHPKWPGVFISSLNPYISWYLHCITPEPVKDIGKHSRLPKRFNRYARADSRFAPGQWETSLQSNAISHWLGANLDSALYTKTCTLSSWHTVHPWWRHPMETRPELLAVLRGNPPVTDGFPSQRAGDKGLMLWTMFVGTNGCLSRRVNGDLRHYDVHCDMIVHTVVYTAGASHFVSVVADEALGARSSAATTLP